MSSLVTGFGFYGQVPGGISYACEQSSGCAVIEPISLYAAGMAAFLVFFFWLDGRIETHDHAHLDSEREPAERPATAVRVGPQQHAVADAQTVSVRPVRPTQRLAA